MEANGIDYNELARDARKEMFKNAVIGKLSSLVSCS